VDARRQARRSVVLVLIGADTASCFTSTTTSHRGFCPGTMRGRKVVSQEDVFLAGALARETRRP
jgi:hypothetical protein